MCGEIGNEIAAQKARSYLILAIKELKKVASTCCNIDNAQVQAGFALDQVEYYEQWVRETKRRSE